MDLGSGSGWAAILARRDGFDAFCVDVSDERLIDRREIVEDCQAEFTLGDGQWLPFKDEVFDVIFCCHVLEHILSDRQALSEICRVLADNGIFFLSVPNKHNLSTRFKTRLRLKSGYIEPNHLREYDEDEIRSLLENHGLRTLALGMSGFLLPFGNLAFNFLVVQFDLRWVKGFLSRSFRRSSESINVMACKKTLDESVTERLGKVLPGPWWL